MPAAKYNVTTSHVSSKKIYLTFYNRHTLVLPLQLGRCGLFQKWKSNLITESMRRIQLQAQHRMMKKDMLHQETLGHVLKSSASLTQRDSHPIWPKDLLKTLRLVIIIPATPLSTNRHASGETNVFQIYKFYI